MEKSSKDDQKNDFEDSSDQSKRVACLVDKTVNCRKWIRTSIFETKKSFMKNSHELEGIPCKFHLSSIRLFFSYFLVFSRIKFDDNLFHGLLSRKYPI